MKRKFVAITIIVVSIILAYGFYLTYKDFNKDSEIIDKVNKAGKDLIEHPGENTNTDKNTDVSYEGDNDKYIVDEGFLSTVDSKGTIEQIIEKNNLQENDTATIKEKLMAKNVAENFVQAICSFDIDKPKETVDKATKYVVDEKKEEIESLYIYLGKNKDIKKTVMEKVISREVINREDTNYIVFKVRAEWSVIDAHDKKVGEQHESYEVSLVKIDDEYRVIQYRIS